MKLLASLTLTFSALILVFAESPTSYTSGYKLTDGDILNYALTLEHLEDAFYRAGLANYTRDDFLAAGFPDPFYQNLKEVSVDETAHVAFLTDALKAAGVTPVPECTYGFPSTTAKEFVALSSVLEGSFVLNSTPDAHSSRKDLLNLTVLGVGVSAYLGAAADIMSDTYLTAAGSILSIESRHSAYIRAALNQKPFPSPFDTPLRPNEVNTLARGFILSCPPGTPPLPVKAFPALALATRGTITTGTTITITTPGYVLARRRDRAQLYGAFVSILGPVFVDLVAVEGGFQAQVPAGIAGQSYFLLSNCKERVSDDTIVAGPVIVEVTT